MNTDRQQQIQALLREGLTNQRIAARAHVGHRQVAKTRAEMGLRKHRGGRKAADPATAFYARTRPQADGHLEWTGTRLATTPSLYVDGRQTSARRLAFRLRNGREPVGYVLPGCDYAACVHPDHMEDQAMRDQYTAIFGDGP
ncbi:MULTISPECIES: hypothetical protein [unclassified Streptomyces]|uniref:hypothetical protein n=1 Tax=unclassified Streptomyces TaxID=2593676 RepID=UPI00136D06B1|nr:MULTISPECIES: hypothetical protein [unclassified Streptomyces]NEA03689.1 hypothetical protein [Streptomyces sp. SID10116]MYY79705.1 hypothetical protein [Streptomyces sp. SID335]MYZ12821.1 hypothetical protein [Streptomyces sp. SID337]NDZ91125.1 hypothetical protein [Streptomyces sp. SID10115]NEB43522.1 hypothetical protein [Streptomyces sp. SID339]